MRFHLTAMTNRVVRSTAALGLTAASALILVRPMQAADPFRVSEEESRRALAGKPAPTMPMIARQAHLAGKVVADVTVAEDGKVEKVDIVSGNPILAGAVTSATKQWTFTPFQSNGTPSKAIVRATFAFGS